MLITLKQLQAVLLHNRGARGVKLCAIAGNRYVIYERAANDEVRECWNGSMAGFYCQYFDTSTI